MNIRLTHLDGTLPNLALMKLSHWHKAQGDTVHFTTSPGRTLYEPEYDIVYASSVFVAQDKPRDEFLANWANHPRCVIGGTGTGDYNLTIEQVIGIDPYEYYDYSIYPDYKWSLGFTSRGCRLRCPFCSVPVKEGRIRSVNTISDIYRPGTPRNIVLFDNDFFGQPRDQWIARCQELIDGNFKVSLNQGINVRLITDESAAWLSRLVCYDGKFKNRRISTAWDNVRDETVFLRGIDHLLLAGIKPSYIMVYMLIGFEPNETIDEILYRFNKIDSLGMLPFPMVYNKAKLKRGSPDRLLHDLQRWAIGRFYKVMTFADYRAIKPSRPSDVAVKKNLLSIDNNTVSVL